VNEEEEEEEEKKKKKKKKKKIVKEKTECEENLFYIYITNADKDCDLLQDRPVLPSERTPHDKQNRNCPDYSQNMVMCPRWAQCKD
jgi:hypothetical protein